MPHLQRLSITATDKDHIKAMHSITVNPETRPLLEYLSEELDTLREKGDYLTGHELQWNQGACQVLQEILALPSTAKSLLRLKAGG